MTTDFLLVNKLIVFLINIVGLGLAFWIYLTNRKEKVNQIFSLVIIFIILWIDFELVCTISPFLDVNKFIIFVLAKRLAYGALCIFFIFAYFLSLYFPREVKKNYLLDKIYITVWSILFFLSTFTPWIIKGAEWKEGAIEEIGSGGFLVFHIAALFSVLICLYNLFGKYRLLREEEKLKVKYFLIGVTFFAAFNLLFNIILPMAGNYQFHHFGQYSAIFLFAFTGYAIIKQELFGIKVILTELLVGVMGVILLIVPFLIDILWLKILVFTIFLLFCIFAYLLIKSTLREVKERETLEKKVEERTEDLQEKAENLQEKERQLQERIDELEKFHKLTVGRELKMVELKREVKKLEKELEKKEKK